MKRMRTIWGVLGLLIACNTFDDAPASSEPRNLLPTEGFAGAATPFPGQRVAGAPAPPPFPTGGFGAAGVAGMPAVRWQPIDAGPPIADADGGADDAGSSKPAQR